MRSSRTIALRPGQRIEAGSAAKPAIFEELCWQNCPQEWRITLDNYKSGRGYPYTRLHRYPKRSGHMHNSDPGKHGDGRSSASHNCLK